MSLLFRRSTLNLLRRYSSKVPKNGNLPKKSNSDGPRSENIPKAGAAPMPELKTEKDEVSLSEPYQPKDRYQRVSFEYPTESPGSSTTPLKMRKYLPHMFMIVGGAWALLTASYFYKERKPTDYLNPDEFIPFFISNRVDIDKDHYLLELTPKFKEWMKDSKKSDNIWNGRRLWSVEIKQPQIMVVRKYTPLPLAIYQKDKESEPIINLQSPHEHGKMVLYIKKYDQGEVARWIYKRPIGSELELRGPFIEYEFPKTPNDRFERPKMENLPSSVKVDDQYPIKPDNLAFFAGGTGVAPVLQTLLSKNPYKGHVNIFYSRKTESELPIPRFFYFLEKLGRVKVHHLVNEKGDKLTIANIPTPVNSHYKTLLDQQSKGIKVDENFPLHQHNYKSALEKAIAEKSNIKIDNPALALVCGPDGYVDYVAGPKPYEGQGPVGGLLQQRGWDKNNVFKL